MRRPAADVIDELRIFPRMFLLGYGALCWKTALWFMALESPSPEQSAFVTIVVSVFAPLCNFYMSSGNRKIKGAEAPKGDS